MLFDHTATVIHLVTLARDIWIISEVGILGTPKTLVALYEGNFIRDNVSDQSMISRNASKSRNYPILIQLLELNMFVRLMDIINMFNNAPEEFIVQLVNCLKNNLPNKDDLNIYLSYIVKRGNYAIADELISLGANPNGGLSLDVTRDRGDIKFWINRGATNLDDTLIIAVKYPSVANIKILLDAGAENYDEALIVALKNSLGDRNDNDKWQVINLLMSVHGYDYEIILSEFIGSMVRVGITYAVDQEVLQDNLSKIFSLLLHKGAADKINPLLIAVRDLNSRYINIIRPLLTALINLGIGDPNEPLLVAVRQLTNYHAIKPVEVVLEVLRSVKDNIKRDTLNEALLEIINILSISPDKNLRDIITMVVSYGANNIEEVMLKIIGDRDSYDDISSLLTTIINATDIDKTELLINIYRSMIHDTKLGREMMKNLLEIIEPDMRRMLSYFIAATNLRKAANYMPLMTILLGTGDPDYKWVLELAQQHGNYEIINYINDI